MQYRFSYHHLLQYYILQPEWQRLRAYWFLWFYGHKIHQITDTKSEIVVAVQITPANIHDIKPFPDLLSIAKALLQDNLLAITADKAYNGRTKE